MVVHRFDNNFSKNLIDFFDFVSNCRFYFVFLVVSDLLYKGSVWLAFPEGVDEPAGVMKLEDR